MSSENMIYIRKTTPADCPAVCLLYEQARTSMRQNGIDQWQNGYPNEDTLTLDISRGISIVCESEGKILATAAAYTGHEPTYDRIRDGCWRSENDIYGIIHRIAVSPDAKQKGTASAIVHYVESLSRSLHLSSMRCDTHRDNYLMQGMLRKNGYEACGVICLEDGSERIGFEKLLS